MNTALIQDSLGQLLTLLNLPFDSISVDETEGEGFIRVDIVSNTPSRLIGWHGETLNSVQHLLKSILRSKEKLEKSPFIVLDVDGYRREQEEKVKKMAENKADFVRRTGNRVALAPMSPYFRRIVHLHIANNPTFQDLTTESIGEGDYRQVVLRSKSKKDPTIGEELSPVMEEAAPSGEGFENLDV
ncbi:MAG: R3H domain-containing nucleic acid-binding protein [Candidatus Peregrinibacteria bacterium]